ncbi:hypothetical protein MFIFM68171_04670 [Madurella fahalii]|uniref:Uncharacterized protein n=1 Tax=Madurella fahalii TaxID=1157608 RepID=A0ABQ0GA52_9PEZI
MPPGNGCTEYSFSYPAWAIEKLHIERGDSEWLSQFRVTNTASGVSQDCDRQPVSGSWTPCTEPAAKSQPGERLLFRLEHGSDTWSVSINETWSCNDLNPGHRLLFSGNSNATALPLSCDDRACVQSQTLTIKAGLSAPVPIVPQPPQPPQNHDFPGCMDASETPRWQISGMRADRDFIYNAFTGGIVSTTLSFNLTNKANNWTVTCNVGGVPDLINDQSASSNLPPSWTACDKWWPYWPAYVVQTQAMYNWTAHILQVKQSWGCDDKSPLTPLQEWKDTTWSAPCSEPLPPDDLGHFGPVQHECRGFRDRAVQGTLTSETRRASMEFVAKRPPARPPYSCTATVFSRPAFDLFNFTYMVGLNPNDSSVSVPTADSALADWGYAKGRIRVRGSPWYDANFRAASPFLGPNATFWRPDVWLTADNGDGQWQWFPGNGTLRFRNRPFYCDEKQPNNRVVFRLTGEAAVPLDCAHPDPASPGKKSCSLRMPYLFDAALETYSFWWCQANSNNYGPCNPNFKAPW